MKNLWVVVAIIVIIGLLGAFFLLRPASNSNTANSGCTKDTATRASSSTSTASSSAEAIESVTISYENGKFSPDCVLIKSGGSLTWANKSDQNIQIGSDPHPLHTGNREVSNGEFTLDLAPGETFDVTINKTGTNGFHNHLNSSEHGTIIVQ